MSARRHDGPASSAGMAPERMIWRARKAGLFDQLARIYAEFPRTTCGNCARCCFESPGVFYLEYLRLLELLGELPRKREEEYVRKAFRELLFSWIEPERTCIFLESGACTIYDARPLACRLFGLVPAGDREAAEAQARLSARHEARRLGRLGIAVPEAVVQRALASCDRVRDAHGKALSLDGEAYAARVARLDAALLPRQIVIEEFCFRSLPERMGAAALGENEVEVLRLQLLRRAQKGEAIAELLALALSKAKLPRARRGRQPS